MAGNTTYEKNRILEAQLGNVAYVQADPVYVSLFSVAPDDAGAGGTELSGNGYARIAIETGADTEFDNPASGATANTNIVPWTSSGDAWVEAVALGIHDASTAGNLLRWDFLGTLEWLFSAANTGDLVTAPGHSLANGDRVVVRARLSSTLPTGYSADTIYYVIGVSGNTFQLSLTSGGSAITLSADGAGSIRKLAPVTVSAGGTAQFAAGALDIFA